MADAGDAVELGDPRRGADEEAEAARLGAEIALAVDAREEVGDVARVLPLAVRKTRSCGTKTSLKTVNVSASSSCDEIGASHSLSLPALKARATIVMPGRVDGDREGDRVVGVLLAHRARRDHDQLLRADRARRVRLGAADDDAVGVALDDVQVHVGVVLVGGALAAVALDVRDRGRRHELLALEAAHVVEDALVVGGAVRAVDVDGRDHQRLQLVPADARVPAQGRALGQQLRGLEVLEQVLGARRHVPEDVAVLAVQVGARDHRLGGLGIEGGLVQPAAPRDQRRRELGVRARIDGLAPPAEVGLAEGEPPAQFLGCAQRHHGSCRLRGFTRRLGRRPLRPTR